jgi:hypothetical protein
MEDVMVSPEAIVKIRQIYAEASALGNQLDNTPPAERASLVRGLLLDHCLQLRAIIDAGTTHAAYTTWNLVAAPEVAM